MDPSTYKSLAESYIASKNKYPARPTTHLNCRKGDLVCDQTNSSEKVSI